MRMLTCLACVCSITIALGFTIPPAQLTLPIKTFSTAPSPLPLVLWHGLGDNYDRDAIKAVGKLAAQVHPGTHFYPIRLSNDSSADSRASFFGNLTEQLSLVCNTLSSHPILSKAPAVNALGFSQGGQFLRAYVQRCNDPPVRTLVTFGSQHNGIRKFQTCKDNDWLCKAAAGLLTSNTWSRFVQGELVPAQYFRDPEDLEPYLASSNFLADVNNERVLKNETYKENLSRLKKLVMYVFKDDEVVVPKESGWFAEVNATTGEVTHLRNRTLYDEDWLGLKTLDERGGLVFKEVEGAHMHLTEEILRVTFKEYYAPEDEDGSASPPTLEEDWVTVDHGDAEVLQGRLEDL